MAAGWRMDISKQFGQEGRGVGLAAEMFSEFPYCLAARFRALCACK